MKKLSSTLQAYEKFDSLALYSRPKKDSFFSINVQAMTVYFFAASVSYLTGAYLGKFFMIFAAFLIIVPLFSFLLLLIAASKLRYSQFFDDKKLTKGQKLVYQCFIENNSIIPLPHVKAVFHAIHLSGHSIEKDAPNKLNQLEDLEFRVYLPGNQYLEREKTIELPYRGIYTIGLLKIELKDILNLFTLTPRIRKRICQVYPRIIPIKNIVSGSKTYLGMAQKGIQGLLPDYALFNHLEDYRQGNSIRHLAWKKFASTGIPVIKNFDSTIEPSVTVYVDLEYIQPYSGNIFTAQDTTVETLVALTKQFLSYNRQITIKAAAKQFYEFTGNHSSDFEEFYESTFKLNFDSQISISKLSLTHSLHRANIESDSIFFITHKINDELFAHLQELSLSPIEVSLIYNQHFEYPEKKSQETHTLLNQLQESGIKIAIVRGPDHIDTDLEILSIEN